VRAHNNRKKEAAFHILYLGLSYRQCDARNVSSEMRTFELA